MMEEIREIGEIIAPRMFGKKYHELTFSEGGNGTRFENSELFQVAAMAQTIRLEALAIAREKFGRGYGDIRTGQLMELVDVAIERRDREAKAK
jgi:hypothetical protein